LDTENIKQTILLYYCLYNLHLFIENDLEKVYQKNIKDFKKTLVSKICVHVITTTFLIPQNIYNKDFNLNKIPIKNILLEKSKKIDLELTQEELTELEAFHAKLIMNWIENELNKLKK